MADPHSFVRDTGWAAWDAASARAGACAPPIEAGCSAPAKATTHAAPRPAVRRPGHGIVARVNGSTARRLTVYLPVDLYRRVKLHVAGLEGNLSEFVTALLDREIGR
ncbi:MAG: hypothetical protein HY744_17840 [Deltaproteobacteria bacterium]|nr:hypothetical protein [Deltaproteobacteria bacterium]